jgi:hypothetical protein
LEQLKEKRDSPAPPKLRFESFHEGLCMQIVHVGPYAEEPRTIAKMQAFAAGKAIRCGASITRSSWAIRVGPNQSGSRPF